MLDNYFFEFRISIHAGTVVKMIIINSGILKTNISVKNALVSKKYIINQTT